MLELLSLFYKSLGLNLQMSGNYKINLTESLTWKRKSGEGRQGKQGVETEGENDSV